ncbi:segregation/condensation protein A [bacterium]|nr:segregation/condensation protein A [bacterium]
MDNIAENFYSIENKLPDDNFGIMGVEAGTDGIALLVSMAKAGKIDPWNIDIVDITDKYLVQMAEKKANNLRNTGRTIWLASVLLKLKSNVLVGLDPMDFDSIMEQNNFEEYDDNFEADYKPIRKSNVVSLDEALKRRLSTRLNRKRTVTLQDLIKQLKFYEELDKKQALKNSLERAKTRARNYDNISARDFVKHASDNESIKITINTLTKKLEKIFIKCERVELNDLVDVGMEKVSAFMALLFLTAENKVSLYQEEIYGDLYIQKAGTVEQEENNTEKQEEISKTQSIEKEIYFKEKTMKFGGMQSNIIKPPPIKEAVAAS